MCSKGSKAAVYEMETGIEITFKVALFKLGEQVFLVRRIVAPIGTIVVHLLLLLIN